MPLPSPRSRSILFLFSTMEEALILGKPDHWLCIISFPFFPFYAFGVLLVPGVFFLTSSWCQTVSYLLLLSDDRQHIWLRTWPVAVVPSWQLVYFQCQKLEIAHWQISRSTILCCDLFSSSKSSKWLYSYVCAPDYPGSAETSKLSRPLLISLVLNLNVILWWTVNLY